MTNPDLRPMTLGEVLDRTFRLYKSHFLLFTGIMALPFLLLFVFNVFLEWFTRSERAIGRVGGPAHADPATAILVGAGAGILVLFLTFILSGIGQAATIFTVSDVYLNRPVSVRGAFAHVRGHIASALGTIFLTGLMVGAGMLLLFIPGIILACRTGVAVPAAMLEDDSPGSAISRSMDLTRGFSMQMFLIFLLTWVLAFGAAFLIAIPFGILAVTPRPHVLPLGVVVLQHALNFLEQVLIAPIGAIAFSLMYYNLRVRKEAFDLEHLMGTWGQGASSGGAAAGTVLGI